MDEGTAYEIAIRARDEFEDLLDDKNIMIPSAIGKGARRRPVHTDRSTTRLRMPWSRF
jgi:hypothetical protein